MHLIGSFERRNNIPPTKESPAPFVSTISNGFFTGNSFISLPAKQEQDLSKQQLSEINGILIAKTVGSEPCVITTTRARLEFFFGSSLIALAMTLTSSV